MTHYGVPPVPVVPVVGGIITSVDVPLITRCPAASMDTVMVMFERGMVMRTTPLRPSWRATVPCPESPPASRGTIAVITKLQIVKVWMTVPAVNPAILLFEMVKVQDPKATVPVAVPPPVRVNVDDEVNVNVTGVFGRPGLKAEPSGMGNGCPAMA